MIFDGREFTEDLKNALRTGLMALARKPRLDIIYVGADASIESFTKTIIRVGNDVGVSTVVRSFSGTISQRDIICEIQMTADDTESDGIIVQLPLPAGIDTEAALRILPPEKDICVLSAKAFGLFMQGKIPSIPPVARAMMDILRKNRIILFERQVVVLGLGRLVGKPMRVCLEKAGAIVTGLDRTTGDPVLHLRNADIIISGVGKAHLIKPEMVKDGVVIIDGGTSELNGKIAGDADPACAGKCSFLRPFQAVSVR